MQVYKIRNFYYKLFIGMTVVLIAMFLFAFANLNEIPMVLIVFPFIMIGRVFSVYNREILFLKEDHLEWDPGMGKALSIGYNTILNVDISHNLKTVELKVKDGEKVEWIDLQLSYLNKEVRPEVAEFLKSKVVSLAVA